MPQIVPPAVDALPAVPSTQYPATFSTLADAWILALATFATQLAALATNAYNNAVDAYNSATNSAFSASASASSATASANSATSAAAASGAALWVSGTTYTAGSVIWSPINFQSYRRMSGGAGTTDPSLDNANWAVLGPGKFATALSSFNATTFFGGF